MVVALIDDGDIDRLASETLGRGKSAEAGADDHNAWTMGWLLCHFAGLTNLPERARQSLVSRVGHLLLCRDRHQLHLFVQDHA